MKPYRAITVCEGEFCSVEEFDSVAELSAYARGFSDAANQYGAGSAGVYSRDDLTGMYCLDPAREADAEIIAMIHEYLWNPVE